MPNKIKRVFRKGTVNRMMKQKSNMLIAWQRWANRVCFEMGDDMPLGTGSILMNILDQYIVNLKQENKKLMVEGVVDIGVEIALSDAYKRGSITIQEYTEMLNMKQLVGNGEVSLEHYRNLAKDLCLRDG